MDIREILAQVASLARELGSSPFAVQTATERLAPKLDFTWYLFDMGMPDLTPGSRSSSGVLITSDGATGYIYSRRLLTPQGYITEVATLAGDDQIVSPRQPEEDVLGSIKLSWRILPPGEHPFPEIVKHFEEIHKNNPRIKSQLDRLNMICDLNPNATYIGTDEFRGYVIFYFQEYSAAILDCPVWGNAIYLIRGDWKRLSRLTKKELLTDHRRNVIRVVHSGDWFRRLKQFLYISKSV